MENIKITLDFLESKKACSDGIEWFKEKYHTNEVLLNQLVTDIKNDEKYSYLNWLIISLMEKEQHIAYAIYAAEEVLPLFESKYPQDLRPRKAIKAAKEYLKNINNDNASVAANAANAAYAACAAASAAASAAANAAYAAYAASVAVNAANAASAASAAVNRSVNGTAAKIKTYNIIIDYGLSLLKGGQNGII